MPDGSRMYEHPVTGERVPSVTTVMKVAIAKPNLVAWAARTAARYAIENWEELDQLPPLQRVSEIAQAHENVREYASEKGNAVHEVIDKWNKGETVQAPKAVKGQVDQFVSFMMLEQPRFIETEVTLWNRTHAYAGTADWIADFGGTIILGDNKTGKRVYPEVGLQLAALRHAEFIIRPDGTEEPIPAIDDTRVLHIRPRSYKMVWVNEHDANWSAFLAARTLYDWINYSSPTVLGRM